MICIMLDKHCFYTFTSVTLFFMCLTFPHLPQICQTTRMSLIASYNPSCLLGSTAGHKDPRKQRASSIMNNQRKYSQRSGKHRCIFFCHELDSRCIIMTKARLVLPWTYYSILSFSLFNMIPFFLCSPLQKLGSQFFLTSNIKSLLGIHIYLIHLQFASKLLMLIILTN